MKYFFRSPEIYIKLKRSSLYPTTKDAPIVPIRGLWVAGIHRSIFDIDHVLEVTDITTSRASVNDYSSSNETIKDEGCSVLGIVSSNDGRMVAQKYTTSKDTIKDEGCSVLGIIQCNNGKFTTMKYSTTSAKVNADSCSVLGIVSCEGTKIPRFVYRDNKYYANCDSHGIFVSNMRSTRATVTDVTPGE